MTTNRTSGVPRFETEHEFLQERLSQARPARLAVRIVMDWAQAPKNIATRLGDAAQAVGQQLQVAFERHLANISDESQSLATQLTFAEINRVPAAAQAEMVRAGRSAPVVSETAVSQRRVAPAVQAALLEHCMGHVVAMRALAARPDATLDTLARLVGSKDVRTRINVAANVGPRMKVHDVDVVDAEKAAIFSALIESYETDFAPYLVPVCQSPEQLREMYAGTSKALGALDVFVDNPYTPDSVLLDIAASPKMQLVQHGVATRAREMLEVRAELRECSSVSDDMAPS